MQSNPIKIGDVYYQLTIPASASGEPLDLTNIINSVSLTANYEISRTDDATDVEYYGFIDNDGAWYVLKIETLSGVYTYSKGDSDFLTNWNNRVSLTYSEFNDLIW